MASAHEPIEILARRGGERRGERAAGGRGAIRGKIQDLPRIFCKTLCFDPNDKLLLGKMGHLSMNFLQLD